MKTSSILAALIVAVAGSGALAADKAALVEEGKGLMMQFGGALKAELTAAVKAKGAPHAIAVCNVKAPEIAKKVSMESGWTVARSSHKLRNAKNAPDAYTAAVIDDFLKRQAAGEKAVDMAKAEVVDVDGTKTFRLTKAIPTGDLCLNCHGGDNVKPPVVEALAALYPDDMARGFTAGEMRGVFVLTKALD